VLQSDGSFGQLQAMEGIRRKIGKNARWNALNIPRFVRPREERSEDHRQGGGVDLDRIFYFLNVCLALSAERLLIFTPTMAVFPAHPQASPSMDAPGDQVGRRWISDTCNRRTVSGPSGVLFTTDVCGATYGPPWVYLTPTVCIATEAQLRMILRPPKIWPCMPERYRQFE
jgi:hypothetical protein